MVIEMSDNDSSSSKPLTIDERHEFITTIKTLTQSLSNLERTIQEQKEAYQEQINNLTTQVLNVSEQLRIMIEKYEQSQARNQENLDLIKRLKVMCRNGQLDNDELKRLLFQGGQKKLRDKEAVSQNTSASKAKKRR